MSPTPTGRKSIHTVAREWDALASHRLRQIDAGLDDSFTNILAPVLVKRMQPGTSVLDFGCGTGSLTEQIAGVAEEVCGIDASAASIALAKKHHQRQNIEYTSSSIEDYQHVTKRKFDVVVSNMVLMDAPNLESALTSAHALCESESAFHATITHPFFWPKYWGYDHEPWFSYLDEIFIESPFRITGESLGETSTHIHRPLEMYFSALRKAGFKDIRIKELGSDARRRYPRFILLSANAR